MAFAPTKPWKLPFITTWGGSPNRNLPTNSAEEAQRDRKRSIVALTVGFIIQALQILLGSAGRSVFSLDKYLSWMSQGLPTGNAAPRSCPPTRSSTRATGRVTSRKDDLYLLRN